MLKENLILLRNINGYSQEQVAERVGVSRQAYAKWERGLSLPDIENCGLLADLYGVTIDSLLKSQESDGLGTIPPAPRGKYIWGTVNINDRGQVVVPKGAREKFDLFPGKELVVLSDDIGIVLMPKETFERQMAKIMEIASYKNED